MTITDIIEFSKSKYKIFIDHEFAFVLYKGELRQSGIKKGQNISEKIYDDIIKSILPKRAKLRAMHLLEKRPYTERGLREKLMEGLYSSDIIDETIDYLKGYGYIDDRAYTEQYIFTYSESRTAKRMKQELMQKGVDKGIIEQVLLDKKEEGELGDEDEMIRKVLLKRRFDPENADAKTIASTVRYLYGKGFSADAISRVIRTDLS